MAKQSLIEARKAKALEEINMRLARIEEKLGHHASVTAQLDFERAPASRDRRESSTTSTRRPSPFDSPTGSDSPTHPSS